MSEPTVPVPVPLIEQLRDTHGREDTDGANLAVAAIVDRLAQPALTAEPFRPAPDGWFTFGSHVGFHGPLEFSEEKDGGGDPLWERHPSPHPPTREQIAEAFDAMRQDSSIPRQHDGSVLAVDAFEAGFRSALALIQNGADR